MAAEDLWDWVVKGFARIVDMLVAMHNDPTAPPIPEKSLGELSKYAGTLARIVQVQGERRKG